MGGGAVGTVCLAQCRDNAIGRITPAGVIAEYPVPTPRSVPTGICAGPDKNIYFTELDANKIGRVSNLTGGGNVAPGAKANIPGGMGTPRTGDTDCIAAGKAGGG